MRRMLTWVAPAGIALLATAAMGCGAVDSGSAEKKEASKGSGCPDAPQVAFTNQQAQGVQTELPTPRRGKLKIAYANGTDAVEPLHVEGVALKREVEKLGGSFITSDAKGQPDLQVSQIQQFITRGVDGIFVSVIDPGALAPVLKRAQKAGIPVVGVEVSLTSTDPGPGWSSQIWLGRDRLPYLQTQEAVRRLPCKGGFVQMQFAIPVPTIVHMVEGQRRWGKAFGLKPLGIATNPTNDIAGGEKAMTQLLSKYPDMNGLIAYNEESAVGASAAARAAGKRGLPIIGGNGGSLGLSAVKDGRIDATVQLRFPDAGRAGAHVLYGLIQGEKVAKTIAVEPPILVTKANVDQVQTWDATLEQRYGSGS